MKSTAFALLAVTILCLLSAAKAAGPLQNVSTPSYTLAEPLQDVDMSDVSGNDRRSTIHSFLTELHTAGLISDTVYDGYLASNAEGNRLLPGYSKLVLLDLLLRIEHLQASNVDVTNILDRVRSHESVQVLEREGQLLLDLAGNSVALRSNNASGDTEGLDSPCEENCNALHILCVAQCFQWTEVCIVALGPFIGPWIWICAAFLIFCWAWCDMQHQECVIACQDDAACQQCKTAGSLACNPICLMGEMICEAEFGPICTLWSEACTAGCEESARIDCADVCDDNSSTDAELTSCEQLAREGAIVNGLETWQVVWPATKGYSWLQPEAFALSWRQDLNAFEVGLAATT